MRSEEERITVLDIREPREYGRGHIPGALLLPLPKILTEGLPQEFVDDHQIVLACRTGRRSRKAANRIHKDGHSVIMLKGGMAAWEAANLLEAVDY